MAIRPLISAGEIHRAVTELGARITEDFRGRDLTVLGVLTGSIVLVTDLMRQIAISHQLGFLQASSYRGPATCPGELRINFEWLPELKNRDVLLVDDIFDTGRTLEAIRTELLKREPRSLKTAVLLWKTSRQQVSLTPDYACFEIPDEFVVGYGLDHNGNYRHLPFVGVVESENGA